MNKNRIFNTKFIPPLHNYLSRKDVQPLVEDTTIEPTGKNGSSDFTQCSSAAAFSTTKVLELF